MIVLDYRDKRPIYEQVVEKLERLIVCGALEPGSKLPSVRSLAVELSVNPNTIQRAYAQLEQEGYLYTIAGRGNFVTGEQEWKQGKIRAVMKDFSVLLWQTKDLGISRQELVNAIDAVYLQDDRVLPESDRKTSSHCQDSTEGRQVTPADSQDGTEGGRGTPTDSQGSPTKSKTARADSQGGTAEGRTAQTDNQTGTTEGRTAQTDSQSGAGHGDIKEGGSDD